MTTTMKTISDAATAYLEHMASLNYSPKTVKCTAENLNFFLKFLSDDGITDLADLQKIHIGKWQKRITSAKTEKGMPLKPGTMNNRLKNTKGLLTYMARKGYVALSLQYEIEYVKMPKLLVGSVITHEQFEKIAGSIDTTTSWGYQARTIVELMYSSGVRASEVTGLKIADVDFTGGVAKVMGKGSKERMVPIGRTALKYMENFLKAVRPFLVKEQTEYFFVNNKGGKLNYVPLLEWIHKFCKDNDVNVTPHTFRRSCATELLKADANMYHIKELLGHESLDTLKHYAKLTIVDLKKTHRKCHPREKQVNEVSGS